MDCKQKHSESPVSGQKVRRGLRALPVALLIALLSLMYGCKSSSQIAPEVKSKVTIEASLMVKPNYTARLLRLLSE